MVRSRTAQAQVSTRARILLLKADGKKIDEIADKVGLNRNSVLLCLKKYSEGGIENAIYDAPGRGRNPEISDEEKTWIINIACQRPTDFGYAAETWTYAKLTEHIHKTAEAAGYTRLSTIHKTTVNTILNAANIKPHKISYYCERRDPEFETKSVSFWTILLFTPQTRCGNFFIRKCQVDLNSFSLRNTALG